MTKKGKIMLNNAITILHQNGSCNGILCSECMLEHMICDKQDGIRVARINGSAYGSNYRIEKLKQVLSKGYTEEELVEILL